MRVREVQPNAQAGWVVLGELALCPGGIGRTRSQVSEKRERWFGTVLSARAVMGLSLLDLI